jgi:hypothetical protein
MRLLRGRENGASVGVKRARPIFLYSSRVDINRVCRREETPITVSLAVLSHYRHRTQTIWWKKKIWLRR